jgi:DNA-binding SARP family transcriptional activator/Tfp pilus assembly protein PilF
LSVTGTRFSILGPLTAQVGGTVVAVPPGKQRAVLASLLLRANQVVPVDQLVEALWDADPPPSARVCVQNYVMRLRRTLGDAGTRIETRSSGYLIEVADAEFDLACFQTHMRAARKAANENRWPEAATEAAAAVALWRGEPLADLGSDVLTLREGPRLAEMRAQALQTRIDADLHCGRHAELVGELRQLTAAHPLRERLHALLMLALYRDGRQAEALAAYQRARRILVTELGTEPGPELARLHQQILTADRRLAGPAPTGAVAKTAGAAKVVPRGSTAPAGVAGTVGGLGGAGSADASADRGAGGTSEPVVPRELPAPVGQFTGRATELAALTALLADRGKDGCSSTTLVIAAIGGTAGVGKTALAVHWAHQVSARFPDGQLYVNLRGYDPDQPMPATDALAGFLRSLGVPGQDIPVDTEERAARYRSLLAGQRVLVVLDNAASVEQVRPLLPGSASCAVVVTSRDALAGLVARDGAVRVSLDLLPLADATSLLHELIGARAREDPVATTALAGRCARLPLALRVAAELAAVRPATPLAELAGELADRQRRLDQLDAGGDARTAVRAVFWWSYRNLDTAPARMFRLAGLHPGADFEPYALAAMAGSNVEQARRDLDVLVRAHLIQSAGLGRFGMHDLLREYACELAADQDGSAELHAALTRMLDHYLHTAATAMDLLHPVEKDHRPCIRTPAVPSPPVADRDAALCWLDTERTTLTAAVVYAATHDWPERATQLAGTLFRYLDGGGDYAEAITIYTHARRAARRTHDRAAEVTALNALGLVHLHQSRCEHATTHLAQALALARLTGDRTREGRTLCNLGIAAFILGNYQRAIDHYEASLALHSDLGDKGQVAMLLSNLSMIDQRQGRYAQAAERCTQALALYEEISDSSGSADALVQLGAVEVRRGRCERAIDHYQRALRLHRQVADRFGEAEAIAGLGVAFLNQRDFERAAGQLRAALELRRELLDRAGEADVLNCLGQLSLATGAADQAGADYGAALELASQVGEKYQQARAHSGLARCSELAGQLSHAQRHRQVALALFTALGAPESEQVSADLAESGCASSGRQLRTRNERVQTAAARQG